MLQVGDHPASAAEDVQGDAIEEEGEKMATDLKDLGALAEALHQQRLERKRDKEEETGKKTAFGNALPDLFNEVIWKAVWDLHKDLNDQGTYETRILRGENDRPGRTTVVRLIVDHAASRTKLVVYWESDPAARKIVATLRRETGTSLRSLSFDPAEIASASVRATSIELVTGHFKSLLT